MYFIGFLSASCKLEAEKHEATKEERAASKSSSTQPFVCPKCGRGMRIKNRPPQPPTSDNLPQNSRLRGMSHHHLLETGPCFCLQETPKIMFICLLFVFIFFHMPRFCGTTPSCNLLRKRPSQRQLGRSLQL